MSTLAIVGPGSLVGRELLDALQARARVERVVLLSEKAAGTELPFRGGEVLVDDLDDGALAKKPDAVIFSPGAARSRRWAKRFAAGGARVVDLSAAFRLDPEVPLAGLGPPPAGRLVSLPGAAALAVARLMAPVFKGARAPRLTVTLLVPVSAAGQAGVVELSRQTAALLAGRTVRPRKFRHRIAFNLIPEVGAAAEAESTIESGFRSELRRLLSLPDLPVAVTALRVPVFFGLSVVIAGATGDPAAATQLATSLGQRVSGSAPRTVKVLDGAGVYPMPSLSVGDPAILAGRVRADGAGGFQLFASADPLRLVADAALDAAL